MIDPTIFFEAADIIEETGWYRGTSGPDVGPESDDKSNCALTALQRACKRQQGSDETGPDFFFRVTKPHISALKAHVGTESIPAWNDNQATVDAVTEALRNCGWEHTRYLTDAQRHEVMT